MEENLKPSSPENHLPSPLLDKAAENNGADAQLLTDICVKLGLPPETTYKQLFTSPKGNMIGRFTFTPIVTLTLAQHLLECKEKKITVTTTDVANFIGHGFTLYDVPRFLNIYQKASSIS